MGLYLPSYQIAYFLQCVQLQEKRKRKRKFEQLNKRARKYIYYVIFRLHRPLQNRRLTPSNIGEIVLKIGEENFY